MENLPRVFVERKDGKRNLCAYLANEDDNYIYIVEKDTRGRLKKHKFKKNRYLVTWAH